MTSPTDSMARLTTSVSGQQISRTRTKQDIETPIPFATLGQFSYAPATQTTVVTTTTTTTTSFPPLLLKPPRNLNELDPKQYPLASTPTPSSIRRFCFNLEGTPTHFREADDASKSLQEFQKENIALRLNNGAVQSVVKTEPRFETPASMARFRTPSRLASEVYPNLSASSRKQPASPVSISEAAERVVATQQRRVSKRTPTSWNRPPALSDAVTNIGQTPRRPRTSRKAMPATPNTCENFPEIRRATRQQRAMNQQVLQKQQQQETPLTLSPQIGSGKSVLSNHLNIVIEPFGLGDLATNDLRDDSSATADVASISAATPPAMDLDPNDNLPGGNTGTEQAGPPPLSLSPIGALDGSLPSPSLSPVTAALNHGNQADYFTTPEDNDDIGSSFELPPPHDPETSSDDARRTSPPSPSVRRGKRFASQQPHTPTLMEIPSMIDSFDSMPSEMQTYLMYQFLRRCSKKTLQFVAETVNPALNCDFLALLPIELSLNIIKFLDLKSLCRAAQVSRKWRNIINTDEWTWKRLFDGDGYVLAEGELRKAIREGWGWQDPNGFGTYEIDISTSPATRVESSSSSSLSKADGAFGTLQTGGRPKRKAAAKFTSRKHQKRKETARISPDKNDLDGFMETLTKIEGPYAAATAAARAVPNPSIGLPSLKGLHLYKSIYRRHHLIRKGWMETDVKPKHIAFRAHQRHVITCLQFDTDKILTGSDDTNINVYDTKTGALRSQLEGHEGGVWALQYEGNTLVSGSTDRSVRVWDIEKGACTQVFQGHTSTVRCLQILMPAEVGRTPDGKLKMMPKQPLIITGSRDANLRVWKLPQPEDKPYYQAGPLTDGECPYFVRTLTGHHHSVRAIAAHADTLVSGSYDCTVRVWKISTGETVHRLQGHTQKVYSVVLDYKRKRCISGSMDNLVKVWSLETGATLFTLEGHTSLVGLLDLSHDRLVSAAADSTLRIWNPENGQCKSILSAHTAAITCFQHDAHKVISGSDRTLKMWNVQTGDFVKDLLTDLGGVWQVKFNDRRCVAAVQRHEITYIEVLDFGAARDGVPEGKRGKRIVVDAQGHETSDPEDEPVAAR
ncbi:MAG: SCF ubiquitin ligase complex subunit cdc4 [Geoglossum simile]|nr:MAG: SCF ubiquitin ligase complex subunit cdc4 [Geoglossum simile]